MKEQATDKEIRDWCNSAEGRDAMRQALVKAQKMANEFNKACLYDPAILRKPMTI